LSPSTFVLHEASNDAEQFFDSLRVRDLAAWLGHSLSSFPTLSDVSFGGVAFTTFRARM
jgi:hypothetical protein